MRLLLLLMLLLILLLLNLEVVAGNSVVAKSLLLPVIAPIGVLPISRRRTLSTGRREIVVLLSAAVGVRSCKKEEVKSWCLNK